MPPKPIPDGYRSITPYLIVAGADAAIAYYAKAFGARERFRMPLPGGKIGHAEIAIGDSVVMLADEFPEAGFKGPLSAGGPSAAILLYVEDVDAVFQRAVDAGAKVVRAVQNQFYGDRSGSITDPFGHLWTIATHVEDVPADELQRRHDEFAKKQCGA